MPSGSSAQQLAPILKKMEEMKVSFNRDRIHRALRIAEQLYGNEKHWTGQTLLQHVMEVLDILLPFTPDEDTIVACLLHHVLKTRVMTLPELEANFGIRVRALVSGVHLLSHVTLENRRNSIEDLRLMLLSVSDDARVVLVILCDRCSVLEHLHRLPLDEQRRVAHDVLSLL